MSPPCLSSCPPSAPPPHTHTLDILPPSRHPCHPPPLSTPCPHPSPPPLPPHLTHTTTTPTLLPPSPSPPCTHPPLPPLPNPQTDIRAALKAKDEEYVKLLQRQAADLDTLLAACSAQLGELSAAYREELAAIEGALLQVGGSGGV